MSWITPRRRLLITAPLAIILPAGLLSYLGLKTIGLLDENFIQVTRQMLSNQGLVIQYSFEREVGFLEDRYLQSVLRFAQANRIESQGSYFIPRENLELDDPLPFAKALLYMRTDKRLIVYRHAPPSTEEETNLPENLTAQSRWRLQTDDPLSTESELQKRLQGPLADAEVQFKNALQNPPQPIEPPAFFQRRMKFVYDIIRTPKESIVYCYHILFVETDEPYAILIGLVLDSDWIAKNILQDRVLKQGGMIRPICVIDQDGKVIASTASKSNQDFEPSTIVPEAYISGEIFNWWSIRFPAKTEEISMDFFQTYENTRAVHIPLIIAGIVIIILAVVGAIRNLSRELTLVETRSAFVAKVSHELRTPLGLIRLFAETLEMGRARDETQGREYLHTITKESERLSRLIDNVLDFSQIEAGQKTYQLRLDSVEEVVNAVADLLRFHAERHNLVLDVKIERDLPKVRFDRSALEQALWNLVSNAIKYSGDGKQIDVIARKDGTDVILEVRDWGIGIHTSQHELVFQQFFRVDDPRVQEKGGSGLGLAVVKHIIDGHGGHLTLESAPGKGSTFGIRLPVPAR